MDLKKQVCCFALAEKIKEIGIKQESAFTWIHDTTKKEKYLSAGSISSVDKNTNIYSAFTVAELFEIIPMLIIDKKKNSNYSLKPYKNLDKWSIRYHNFYTSKYHVDTDTLANALGKVLVRLHEDKVLKKSLYTKIENDD